MNKTTMCVAWCASVLLCACESPGDKIQEWPPREEPRKDYEEQPSTAPRYPDWESQYEGGKLTWFAEHFTPEELADHPKMLQVAQSLAMQYFSTDEIVDCEVVFENGVAKYEVTVRKPSGLCYEVMVDGISATAAPLQFEQEVAADEPDFMTLYEAVKTLFSSPPPPLVGWALDGDIQPYVERILTPQSGADTLTVGGWTAPPGFVVSGAHVKVWTTFGYRCKCILRNDAAGGWIVTKVFWEVDMAASEVEELVYAL
jgi:hypothetical protein